ncbi:MAG: FkbM family methyltransferase [Planctomycetaceae bacterium]|nr:FkbM family methyltransferase [Planctomycetaceae bacterium]
MFIDCGANVGRVLQRQIRQFPAREYYAIEANPHLIPRIEAVRDRYPNSSISIMHYAVWNSDGAIPFYLSGLNSQGGTAHDGSTAVLGKSPRHPRAGVIDYDHPIEVPSLDFSGWIRKTFAPTDIIFLKMDIEGAEYAVLDKMLQDDTIDYVSEAMVEFHYSDDGRITTIDKGLHERIVEQVRRRTRLVEWH